VGCRRFRCGLSVLKNYYYCGLAKVTCLKTGEIYVVQIKNLSARINSHKLKRSSDVNQLLQAVEALTTTGGPFEQAFKIHTLYTTHNQIASY
jgi:hypothetical protein